MTPPEITRLEMDAAIAAERAAAAKSRATIAGLEYERSRLGSAAFNSAPENRVSGFTWLVVAAMVAFIGWAVATDPQISQRKYTSSSFYVGR